MSITSADLRKIAAKRIRENAQPIYSPPKYLCVYNAESRPGFPAEHLYRTIDACGLLTLILNAEVCGVQNFHIYLLRHDRPPIPVDYMLHSNYLGIYDRRGNYVEKRCV